MKLNELKLAIVTHEYFKGSGQELRDFLNYKKIKSLYYIAHQFFYSKRSISYIKKFEKGTLIYEKTSPVLPSNEYLLYLRDAFYNITFALFSKEKIDFYIGINSFNALFGLFLKKLGKVDKVVFMTIDYVMHDRTGIPLLDWLYIKMDRIAFFGSDYTWNVSDRMARQRIIEIGDKAKDKIQITVPIGVPIDDAEKVQDIVRKDNILVYSGGLNPEFGLEIAIKSMPFLIKEFPDLELRIIGDGKIAEDLKKLAEELKVEKNVNFVGFMDTSAERHRWLALLKESTLGLATYADTENNYKKFSDVTKPKDYMSVGLPIITTPVIPLSEDIKKYNLGRVIDDNVDSFVQNVGELLKDENERKKIEQNIYVFSKNMTWENIFKRTFEEMQIEVV